jgi:two-component system cell cycle sensor histidine kinase/response regulator CckA
MNDRTPSFTILVVDDEEAVCSVIARMLQRGGQTVHTATSGPQAVELVERGLPDLKLVLIDLSMPGMSGDELASILTQKLDSNVALILMSGYQPEELIECYTNIGLHGFLQKPFTREVLNQTITSALASLSRSASA